MIRLRGILRLSRRGRVPKKQLILDAPTPEQNLLRLNERIRDRAIIEHADLLRRGRKFFVRLRSTDGVEGIAFGDGRLAFLWPMMIERVLPLFVGQDVRNIEQVVDEVGRDDSNYKLAGFAFWSCVAACELAAFDLLGKTAGLSVTELLDAAPRDTAVPRRIPVYLSSPRRDTTPDEEVARLSERLAETGAAAVKIKIGGRMGRADAMPVRTERLVRLARRRFGDGITIYVDANGSYDAGKAIEVGRLLEGEGVYLFEEPCPWEDFEATRRVADGLDRVLVAGGEQDSSIEKFRWYAAHRGVDVMQPDVIHNGGFVRTLRVARLAATAGIETSYHSPTSDFAAVYMLQIAAVTPKLGRFQEFLEDAPVGRRPQSSPWYSPNFVVRSGVVEVPTGVGLGVSIDPALLRRARIVK
jgi:L-alanine-DL-glutamate epimerase-like enolase superfamily enzyme